MIDFNYHKQTNLKQLLCGKAEKVFREVGMFGMGFGIEPCYVYMYTCACAWEEDGVERREVGERDPGRGALYRCGITIEGVGGMERVIIDLAIAYRTTMRD